jgi:hypothetical protein
MTDKPLPITDPHNVPITFANNVAGSGHFQGNINITLAAARFTPNAEGSVDPDLVITARLRMDIPTATALRSALDGVLALAMKNGTTEH